MRGASAPEEGAGAGEGQERSAPRCGCLRPESRSPAPGGAQCASAGADAAVGRRGCRRRELGLWVLLSFTESPVRRMMGPGPH